MLPWDGLPCCSGLLLKLQSGTYTARVCVTVVNKLSLRLRWLFAISRFAKNCWDEEKKEAKFWFSSARVAELALAYAPRKCLDTSHWTWFKYLKHKAKNNRKLLRRKASVYTSLKQIAGSNYAPKQLSDDLKNYRVLWQRMWKLKKRRGSSLQPQKADNISKAFGLAFPPPAPPPQHSEAIFYAVVQVFAASESCTEHHLNPCSSQNPGKNRTFGNTPSMMLHDFPLFVH